MGFRDIIKRSVLEGFVYTDIPTVKIVVTLGICFLIAVYTYIVYRYIAQTTFYNRNFNIAMAVISLVVSGIIVAMQSNLVISLGMVGALSIVRFRTAIKDPLDLLFLFWSIGTGIICGAGLYKLAFIVALAVTFGILVLQIMPMSVSPYLVVINFKNRNAEEDILKIIKKYSPHYKIDSKSMRQAGINLIIEVRSKKGTALVDELSEMDGVASVSLLYHDAPVKS